MFSKNKLLNFFVTSSIISILVNNYLQDFLLSILCFSIFSLLYVNLVIYKKHLKKYIILYAFILIGYILGIIVSTINLNRINENEIFLNKQYLTNFDYQFKVKQLYKKDEFYNSYIVQINKIGETIVDKNVLGLVYISNNISLQKGDLLLSNSRILNVDNVDSSFDYKKYLLSKNIYFKTYLYNFKTIGKDKNLLVSLDNFRNNILSIINKIYPKEEAIFLAGILIGARENIPKNLTQDLNNSGTTHLIAVSGFNITILIIFLGYLFKFIPIIFRSVLILSFLVIFCFFVGLEASVVRAGIMGILGYIIMISGRSNNSITILLLTSFIMVLYNPFYINYDVSFQLSFLAVLGLIFSKPFFDKVFYFLPDLLSIKESFILTLSAMTFSLPIMMFNFGQVSLLSPFSNILIVWNISIVMLIGFLSVIGTFINSFLGIIIGFPAYLLLKWDISMIHFFGNLDKFILKTDFGNSALYFEVLYFILLGFIIIANKKRD